VEPVEISFIDIIVAGFSYFSAKFVVFMLYMLKAFYFMLFIFSTQVLLIPKTFTAFFHYEFLKTLTLAFFL
jgi:hypothetical protein